MHLLDVARSFMARRCVYCEEKPSDTDPPVSEEDTAGLFKSRDEAVKRNLLVESDSPASDTRSFVTDEEVDAEIAKQTPQQRLKYLFFQE